MKSGAVSRTRIAAVISGMAITLSTGSAFAAAFALQENSGSAIGNAFAGGAASAEDASTLWSNPAGLARLAAPEAALAVHLVTPSFKFRDEGSQPAA
jgi:long-chain fatty acid transport protein